MNKSYIICINSKISVIIPTYYRQIDLSELFDSILRQTIDPIEVIVVDDTPNDSIKTICEVYMSKFEKINTDIKYIRNPRERGITIARNVGVENASGNIILFLDSDVILYPEYIEKILDVFNHDSNALGVQGWIIQKIEYNKIKYYLAQLFLKIFYLDHRSKNSCKFIEYPIILSKIINCEWLTGSNMAYKKIVFSEFGFDENITKYALMEDKLFSHSIFQKYPNSLFITPEAKLIHNYSKEGRMKDKELVEHKLRCRKYVLKKLYGFKGLLIYYRMYVGLLIMKELKDVYYSI